MPFYQICRHLTFPYGISAQQYVLYIICVFSISVHQYVLIQYLCVICTIYNMYLTFLSSNMYLCYYPRFNSKYYSIKKNLLIQFKRYFNSIVKESLILVKSENCPKSAQKVPKIDKKKGDFHQKCQISIQNMIHSFISR